MALRTKLFSSVTLMFAIGAFSVFATAQTSETPNADANKAEKREGRGFGKRGGKMRRGEGMRGHRGGGMGMLRGIELTEAQRDQIKTIRQANKQDQGSSDLMKSIRETRKNGGMITEDQKAQLKQLRSERKAKMESVHQQILAVLTPEQKTQLETRKAEMQKRREEFRQKRQDRIPAKPTDSN